MSLRVYPILCLKGIMDNYAYVLVDEKTAKSAIVDASEAAPIIDFCQKNNLQPEYILVTHHHQDHVGGNLELKQRYKLKIVGSAFEKEITSGMDIGLNQGESLAIGNSKAEVISVPGHTLGHILWYFADDKALFTGDTLFNLCIGGLFEGSPSQMWDSLQKIKKLPDDVLFYQGHEYTRSNLAFLQHQKSDAAQEYLRILEKKAHAGEVWTGIPLGLEKSCNPYLQIQNKQDFLNFFEG